MLKVSYWFCSSSHLMKFWSLSLILFSLSTEGHVMMLFTSSLSLIVTFLEPEKCLLECHNIQCGIQSKHWKIQMDEETWREGEHVFLFMRKLVTKVSGRNTHFHSHFFWFTWHFKCRKTRNKRILSPRSYTPLYSFLPQYFATFSPFQRRGKKTRVSKFLKKGKNWAPWTSSLFLLNSNTEGEETFEDFVQTCLWCVCVVSLKSFWWKWDWERAREGKFH